MSNDNLFLENNRELSKIKMSFDRLFSLSQRYFYLYGEKFELKKNIDNGVSSEKFFELLGQHLKGKIRLGVSCEAKVDVNRIFFAAIDIDYPDKSIEEKYQLAQDLKITILKKLGWETVIEKSRGKGYHIFVPFDMPTNRDFVQNNLKDIIEKDFGLKIKNGQIELFPKGDGISVIFLPCFGLLDKNGFIQESFFENGANCLVSGTEATVIRDVATTLNNAINHVEIKQEQRKNDNPPCIEFAESNWVEGSRQDLALALAGVCRKRLKLNQDEAENLILNIAQNNSDDELRMRKAAIKATYKETDFGKLKACSYFDRELICEDCQFLKSKPKEDFNNMDNKEHSKNLLSLLKSSEDIMQEKDIEWTVKGLFAKKLVSILFSEPGVGKTVLAMDIAVKLSKGKPLFNTYKTERPMKILYFQGDFPNVIFKERLSKMMEKPDDNFFKIVNRYDAAEANFSLELTSEEGQGNIKTIIEEYKPDFVIFDTFISFFDGDENKQKDVKAPIDFLRKITSEYDCSILLCHHSRKRGSGEKRKGLDQNDLIGSCVTARLCALVLAIDTDTEKSTPDEKVNNVVSAKTWFKPIEPFQFIISDNGTFMQVIYTTEEVTNNGKNKLQIAKEKIVSFLTAMPDVQFAVKQLAQIAGTSQRTLNTALSELLSVGAISACGTTKNRAYFFDTSVKPKKKKAKEKEFIDEENSLI